MTPHKQEKGILAGEQFMNQTLVNSKFCHYSLH